MSNNQLVSIISVYHNREDHVVDSITSLLNQTYTEIEIIIVDDGSTDSTYERLSEIRDERLKIIKQANQGFVKALKGAINEAKGEYIAIHGSGDLSFPDRIRKQAEILITHEDVGVVTSYYEDVDYVSQLCRVQKIPPSRLEKLTESLMNENFLCHGAVMFRKDVYRAVGGYREFFLFGQDIDLWLRMSLVTKFHVVNEVLYRRYKLPDGVHASINKLVTRVYLWDTSVQSIAMRRVGMKDIVDEYGCHAGFFRRRNKGVSLKLLSLAVRAFTHSHDWEATRRIVRLSVEERRGVRNSIAQALLAILPQNDGLCRVLGMLIKTGKRTFKARLK